MVHHRKQSCGAVTRTYLNGGSMVTINAVGVGIELQTPSVLCIRYSALPRPMGFPIVGPGVILHGLGNLAIHMASANQKHRSQAITRCISTHSRDPRSSSTPRRSSPLEPPACSFTLPLDPTVSTHSGA